jgi:hypothetical protein
MKVGGIGNDCGGDDGLFYNINSANLIYGSEYQLSALVNTADLNINEKAIISIGDNNNWPYYIEIEKKNYWQEVSFQFKYEQSFMIALGAKNVINKNTVNSPLYFDDIRIEPVLEIEKGKRFIPSSCRLYPAQDSILCQSENENFIANGWYGYCLQKDPANSDVCLLWYPIDAVKGNKGSNTSTMSFTGYSQTGKEPYYCAEMSANFDLVEYRDVYFATSTHDSKGSSPGDDLLYEFDVNNKWCSGGVGGWDNYIRTLIRRKDDNANDCVKAFDGSGTKTGWWWVEIILCLPDNEKNLLIETPSEEYSAKDIQGPGPSSSNSRTICCTDSSPPDAEGGHCDPALFSECNSLNCDRPGNADYFLFTGDRHLTGINGVGFPADAKAGWYKYDGLTGTGSPEYEKGVKVLAYDYKQPECSGPSQWIEDSSLSLVAQAKISHGGACLMEIGDYAPKCSKVVKGDKPWVQRVKGSDKAIS